MPPTNTSKIDGNLPDAVPVYASFLGYDALQRLDEQIADLVTRIDTPGVPHNPDALRALHVVRTLRAGYAQAPPAETPRCTYEKFDIAIDHPQRCTRQARHGGHYCHHHQIDVDWDTVTRLRQWQATNTFGFDAISEEYRPATRDIVEAHIRRLVDTGMLIPAGIRIWRVGEKPTHA